MTFKSQIEGQLQKSTTGLIVVSQSEASVALFNLLIITLASLKLEKSEQPDWCHVCRDGGALLVHLLFTICASPHLWQEAVDSDRKNRINNTRGGNELSQKDVWAQP